MDVKLDKLDFDLENPRFEPVENQIDALQAVVSSSPAKLVKLAEHIVENGINPAERLIVVAAPGNRFVVVEGNRRLAALKLLAKPALLHTIEVPNNTGNAIRRLADGFDRATIETLDAVVFTEKTEAATWIDLKHTGENEGAGTVGWNGIQTARHRKSDPAVKLLDYARTQGLITRETLSSKPFPITSLRRLLGDPFVREALGLELSKGVVRATLHPTELNKGLKRVINDLAAAKITVTKIKTKEDRARYIESLPKSHSAHGKKKLMEAWNISDKAQAEHSDKKRPTRIAIRPEKARDYLIPVSCRLQIPEDRLNKIFWELRRTLKLSTTPNAVATLFRTFLELSVDYYLDANKLPTTNGKGFDLSLEEKAQSVISHLEANNKLPRKAATLAKTHLNQKQSVSNMATFHAFIHNRKATPDPATLLAMWANVEPILVGVYA